MAKEFARPFYSSKAWQECRNEYARRVHHLCENCLKQGIYKPGVLVHHKIEIDPININNPEITLNFDNLELLCRACHTLKHPGTSYRWEKVNKDRRQIRASKMRYKVDEYGRVVTNDPPLEDKQAPLT